MAQILVVDDEVGIRELLSEILADEGHEVTLAESAAVARAARAQARPDLVLLDIWMPDTDGITLLKEWSANGQLSMPVVMMSGHGTIETAVEATRIGALDFLEKPIALQRLLATVRRALAERAASEPQPLSLTTTGRAPALVEIKKRLSQLAPSAATVLLRGAQGVRGEWFARLLLRPSAPFLVGDDQLNESPSEVLQRAAGGILFISDLVRLDRGQQRALEFLLARAERHKVRFVAFSSLDPQTLSERNGFDSALLARLGEVVLRLPALREYAEDVPDFAALALAQLVEARQCAPRRFSVAALNALRQFRWPGDFEEFEGVIKDLALTALDEEIGLAEVERVLASRAGSADASEVSIDRPYREARDAFERSYFERLLAQENGSMSRVAERSGLERTHLYRKMKSLGISIGRREDGG